MKLIPSLLVVSVVALAPAVAAAQPGGYYNQPPPNSMFPGGFHNRTGRLIFGGSLGLGTMSDRGGDITCNNCDYSPIAAEVSGHLGGFINPRLALMGEIQANGQTISQDAYGDTTSLVQVAVMFAAQYWVTPQLWLKGGLGFSHLELDHTYYGTIDSLPENGLAVMASVGYEVLSAQFFSVDLQGRLINGSYNSVDNSVTGATVGVGINWF